MVILPIQGFSEDSPKHISYSFSFREILNNKLLVECKFQGSSTGITELVLPHEWADQLELHKNIDELSCTEHPIENTDQSHIKTIHHNPDDLITIRYSIRLLPENICDETYFRPLGDHAYFYAIGHGMFVIPSKQNSKMDITLKWEDIPPEWRIANSFGAQQVVQEVSCYPNDLQHAAYLAGDFQIIECNRGTNPVYVAIRGKWPFSSDEFVALIEQIFTSQRNFWNDYEFPYYLVSVIPIDTKNFIGGTALINTFSLFLGDSTASKDEYLKRLAWLISHEHFHTWNGVKIRSSEPEGSMYWFSEGFTEYYAVKLNHKNGIMSQNDYVDHINEILIDYFSSPVHSASNETIAKNFWTDPTLRRLPYVRGFTLALHLDTKIESKSEGLSLDNFMHDLLELTNRTGKPFSLDDLANLITKYIDQEELHAIKNSIKDGETIPVLHDALGSDYTLTWEDYVGFNLRKSLATGTIEGVKPGTIPFQAGLLNGSRLLEFNREGTVITLSVIDAKESIQKTISYDLLELKQVPQYVYQTRP